MAHARRYRSISVFAPVGLSFLTIDFLSKNYDSETLSQEQQGDLSDVSIS